MKIGQQVRLLCPWKRHLTGLPLPKALAEKFPGQPGKKTEK